MTFSAPSLPTPTIFNISDMIVNGRQIPSKTHIINPSHEKTTTMAYKIPFEGIGINHSIAGLLITHDMFINVYLIFLNDLTPDQAAPGHTSPVANGNIRIEFSLRKR
jgi:hypothetical protein